MWHSTNLKGTRRNTVYAYDTHFEIPEYVQIISGVDDMRAITRGLNGVIKLHFQDKRIKRNIPADRRVVKVELLEDVSKSWGYDNRGHVEDRVTNSVWISESEKGYYSVAIFKDAGTGIEVVYRLTEPGDEQLVRNGGYESGLTFLFGVPPKHRVVRLVSVYDFSDMYKEN